MAKQDEPKTRGRTVVYVDPDGNERQGWYEDGHVYEDEAASVPIAEGSTFTTDDGRVYEMGAHGGTLVYAPAEVDANGAWVPAGNAWYRRVLALWKRLEQRAAPRISLNADALYRRYRALYAEKAAAARKSAGAKAAHLTGGLASSYAQAAGRSAGAEAEEKLAAAAERLQARTRSVYERERTALRGELREAARAYEADYDRYEAGRKAEQSAADKARSYAYRTAMALLKKGALPDDATLAAAGISKADAEALARYFA